MNNFSAKNRNTIIHELANTKYDLLIIGGGITGVGIALDATARGLKVALVEMQDFAAGTSSRSTKLVHGGLRYLKQFELKLVAEVGKERAIVHRIAPHITKPEAMLLPIVKDGSLSIWSAKIGMWIYEWLAGVKKEEWHKVLTREETMKAEPLFRQDVLLGGISFYEYRTDDARLTIEVIKEAVNRGATALNYLKATEFVYENDKITGIIAQDEFTQSTFEIKANYFVNASGPWIDEIDDLDKSNINHKLHITKGVHIVIDSKKIPIKHSLYFDTPDKRMVFIIPREGKTYIGTTDTFYDGDIINPSITREDREYLLNCISSIFPSLSIRNSDIESSWAGIRPLIQKPGKGPSEISRKDEIFHSKSGLLTIAGGKLTGYRKMAERVVDTISKKIKGETGKNIPKCTTQNILLSGGKFSTEMDFDTYLNSKIKLGLELGFESEEIHILVNRYGSNIDSIYLIAKKINVDSSPLSLFIRVQLTFCIEEEMCYKPTDFFIRRTGALYFNIAEVKENKSEVIFYMQSILNWELEVSETFFTELEKAIEIAEK